MNATSSGGSSIAAGIRNTIVVWYDWFRGVRTTKSCATAAISAEDDERRPAGRVRAEARQQREDRDGGRERDDYEVRSRLGGELRRPLPYRVLDVLENRARDRAQAFLSPARLRLSSKLVIACYPSPISRTACGAAKAEVLPCGEARQWITTNGSYAACAGGHIPLYRYASNIPRKSEGPGSPPGPSSVLRIGSARCSREAEPSRPSV